jgi:hypothetical protein
LPYPTMGTDEGSRIGRIAHLLRGPLYVPDGHLPLHNDGHAPLHADGLTFLLPWGRPQAGRPRRLRPFLITLFTEVPGR